MLEQEPLGPVEARQLIRSILGAAQGTLFFSPHCLQESMLDENITEDEVVSCLSRGFCGSNITFSAGSWRYPIEVPRLTVVVAFDTEFLAIIITTWRRT